MARPLEISLFFIEHLGVKKSRRKLVAPSPSSIWERSKQTGYIAFPDDCKIICRTDNSFDLLIRESLLIQRDRPVLNF